MGYLFVAITIALTVYGQLVIKWQVDLIDPSVHLGNPVSFYLHLLLKPWVLSGLAAAFGASLSWMAALSKLPISHAYPLTALSFVLVVVWGATLFAEPFGRYQLAGVILIVAGIAIGVQS